MILVFVVVEDNATHIGLYPVVFDRNSNQVEMESAPSADNPLQTGDRVDLEALTQPRRAGSGADPRARHARRTAACRTPHRERGRPFAARGYHPRRRNAALLLPLPRPRERTLLDAPADDHAGFLYLYDADARESQPDRARPRELAHQPDQRSLHSVRLSAGAAHDPRLRTAALRAPEPQ